MGCNYDSDQKESADTEVEAETISVALAQPNCINRSDDCGSSMVVHCLSLHRSDVLRANTLFSGAVSFVERDVPHNPICGHWVRVVFAQGLVSHRYAGVCCSNRLFSRTLYAVVAMVVYCGQTHAAVRTDHAVDPVSTNE